jgi:hypothetical protein
MLNVLQGFKSQGKDKITVEDIKKFNGAYVDIFSLLFNGTDPVQNYQFLVSEYSNRVDDVLASLGTELIEYMKVEQPEYLSLLPEITVNVAKYQAQRTQVIDPVVTLLACVYELQMIIKKA